MAGITLRTARQVVPMIYAYTTPWKSCPGHKRLDEDRLHRAVGGQTPETAEPTPPMCCTMRSGGAMPSTMTAAARCSPTTISTPTSAS